MAKKGRLTNEEKERKKGLAKVLFLQEKNISFKEIAERIEVSEKTIADWVKNEKWEGLRRNILLTRQEQLVMMQDFLSPRREAYIKWGVVPYFLRSIRIISLL